MDEISPPEIGPRLRKLRKRRGLSLRALAGLCGLSANTISLVERGVASVDAIESAFSHLEGPTTKAPRSRTVQQAPPKGQSRQTPIQRFEQQLRKLVVAAYHEHGGNATAMEKDLKRRGVTVSRKRIASLLDEMGLKRVKRRRRG